MATGDDFTKSIAEGSEEIFDKCCSPCSESGMTKEADKFCVECGSYFCAKCLLYHNKFPVLRPHQIVDKSGQNNRNENFETGTSLPTERCSMHHGKLVDMFCKDHDEVCCAVCIAIKHRACVNVDYLPDVSKGIRDSTEYNDTKYSLQNILSKMKQKRETRKHNLSYLQKQKDELLEDVDSFQEQLIKKIKKLADTSKKQIGAKYEDSKKVIQSDLDTLDTVISTTTTSEQKLSSKNEAQLFVNIKTSKVSIKSCEALLSDMSKVKTNEELVFTLNQELKETLKLLGCLVDFDPEVFPFSSVECIE
ncbi:E3 ubiquitin/ISG15 ligase TRIM25-like [Mercenaria mercenaria]|uniref:E3 ubiquitin/ISG15 ligase TRIM25-like n=1 Tax=Mercenaria mercenaria TaxID=6596 RepID=UPI00234EAA70|nr:E3 ubiquitin/ISG15 ligase TRIM25-like [Mercenaria mercenaria]